MRKKLLLMLLAAMLVLSACSKQPETVTANTEVSEQVEETKVDDIKKEPTIGESTEEELKAEAEAKAKAEAEKKAAEEAAKLEKEKKEAEELKAKEAAEAAAKAEAEKKAAEEAAKKEQESQQSQASKPDSSQSKPDSSQSQTSTPESKPAESKPDTNTSTSSGGYTLNEYGNPSRDIVGNGLVDYINPSDPAITRMIGVNGYHGSTPIPNPCAKIDPVSPFIGMSNPPADWPKPDASKEGGGFGEYKWDSETGCWRFYNGLNEATEFYMSLYGQKTYRSSHIKEVDGDIYYTYSANIRGVY